MLDVSGLTPAFDTVARRAETLVEVRRSKFIAVCDTVGSESGALEVLESVKEKHRQASHNVYALKVWEKPGLKGWEIRRMSDDGEPAGTAGAPVLGVIEREGLRNVIVVVTRYFGGTLLGAGGLVRAYSEAASRAVKGAGRSRKHLNLRLEVKVGHSHVGKIQHLVRELGGQVANEEYGKDAFFQIILVPDAAGKFETAVGEMTSGAAAIRRTGFCYR